MTAKERQGRTIVLVGGGHAHLHVVDDLGRNSIPGWRVRLVSREAVTPYSGMLPGVVAGHYGRKEMEIDLADLCTRHGVGFLQASACGIDRSRRRLLLADGCELGYDLLSLDIGIAPAFDAISGAAENAIPVKPIGTFLQKIEPLIDVAQRQAGRHRIAIVGGGAAGAELVLALFHRLQSQRPALALVTGGALLDGHAPRVSRIFRSLLDQRGIALYENAQVAEINAASIRLADGSRIGADAVLLATHGVAPAWLARTGLTLEEGFLAVSPTLQSLDDPAILAVGDCAALIASPRPKAGVYAVRAGPPLALNLRALARGRQPAPWKPQEHHLSLLSTGDKSAVAARGRLVVAGRLVWRLKDRIDRNWVGRYGQ